MEPLEKDVTYFVVGKQIKTSEVPLLGVLPKVRKKISDGNKRGYTDWKGFAVSYTRGS
ncbi:hypothetical protein [Legionella pneumophila]|uniref:hypothetical protein n=1 Tax=Legionella pneumophila TaxID=446 RepID=UPI0013752840|nr:hypothetical protein [Legionella pneumophila]